MNLIQLFRDLAIEEDGAQVIEYSLIIAVVSIALVLALQGLDGGFAQFIQRVTDCLTGGACSVGGGGGGETPTP